MTKSRLATVSEAPIKSQNYIQKNVGTRYRVIDIATSVSKQDSMKITFISSSYIYGYARSFIASSMIALSRYLAI
jgi:hypothetical protein